jgi:hypothetical protein
MIYENMTVAQAARTIPPGAVLRPSVSGGYMVGRRGAPMTEWEHQPTLVAAVQAAVEQGRFWGVR